MCGSRAHNSTTPNTERRTQTIDRTPGVNHAHISKRTGSLKKRTAKVIHFPGGESGFVDLKTMIFQTNMARGARPAGKKTLRSSKKAPKKAPTHNPQIAVFSSVIKNPISRISAIKTRFSGYYLSVGWLFCGFSCGVRSPKKPGLFSQLP